MDLLNTAAFCRSIKIDELEVIEIDHPTFKARLCLQGAQLLSFIPSGEHDYLWLSDQVEYKAGKSLRGGIPICWPWFGVVDKNPDSVKHHILSDSAHGFARSLPWQLKGLHESVRGVELSMSLGHSDKTLKDWPFEFELTAHFKFSKQLTVELETHNIDSKTMHISQALHTYFPCKHISQVSLGGANNRQYVDALDDWKLKNQVGNISFTEEVDRIYQTGGPFTLHTGLKPRVLSTKNSDSSIVWNPWITKSQTLSQFNHGDFNTMFCVESANALHDAVTITPGDRHILSMRID